MDYKNLQLLVLDVDGVLTDGKIVLTPAGEEIKEFHVRDGSGMKFWRRMGNKIAIVSGRGSQAVQLRAKELEVDALRMNAKDKLPAYESILQELSMTPEQAAVVGDDLPDLPMMLRCALPVAVADAVEEVKQAARHVTTLRGGRGAVRETIEWILRQKGQWGLVLQRYQTKERDR